jgi:hypothetical protein
MSNTNTGGPAFPRPAVFTAVHGLVSVEQDGMTLRDYFAAKAIPFIQWNKDNTELCAKRCYEIADAMLKARDA